MRRRIFIAINLPRDIRENFASYQEKWPEFPAKWTRKENLHITLFFAGHISDEELFEISKIAKQVAGRHRPFPINLDKICYGPPGKMPPRMIWALGEKSEDFSELRKDLEESLVSCSRISVSTEEKNSCPHITLARIRKWEWQRVEPEEMPQIEQALGLNFPAESIEIMESELKRGGAKYTALESHNLGG